MDLLSRLPALVAACAALTACAQPPESILPSYVSDVTYQSFTCQQLGEEQLHLAAALATASQQQESARSNDTVGVIFLGLPVASLSGQNIAPQIALYKGQIEAVRHVIMQKNCATTTNS